MAKSKSKSVEETETVQENVTTKFVPIIRKYKPVPKFNGKCPNC